VTSLPLTSLRVIPFSREKGLFNMALDHYFAQSLLTDATPVLRFYGWEPFCLSLGRHQKADEVNRDALRAAGYDWVRRPTGGSAILHADECTYSIILPRKAGYDHHMIYNWVHEQIAGALRTLNIPVTLAQTSLTDNYLKGQKDAFACFNRKARSEIQYNGKKVVGSAQKLYRETLLQHGSIMLGTTHEKIIDLLMWTEEEKERQRLFLKKNATALDALNGSDLTAETVSQTITNHIGQTIQVDTKTLTSQERDGAYGYYALFTLT